MLILFFRVSYHASHYSHKPATLPILAIFQYLGMRCFLNKILQNCIFYYLSATSSVSKVFLFLFVACFSKLHLKRLHHNVCSLSFFVLFPVLSLCSYLKSPFFKVLFSMLPVSLPLTFPPEMKTTRVLYMSVCGGGEGGIKRV
jgi:hypothetical protein